MPTMTNVAQPEPEVAMSNAAAPEVATIAIAATTIAIAAMIAIAAKTPLAPVKQQRRPRLNRRVNAAAPTIERRRGSANAEGRQRCRHREMIAIEDHRIGTSGILKSLKLDRMGSVIGFLIL